MHVFIGLILCAPRWQYGACVIRGIEIFLGTHFLHNAQSNPYFASCCFYATHPLIQRVTICGYEDIGVHNNINKRLVIYPYLVCCCFDAIVLTLYFD